MWISKHTTRASSSKRVPRAGSRLLKEPGDATVALPISRSVFGGHFSVAGGRRAAMEEKYKCEVYSSQAVFLLT